MRNDHLSKEITFLPPVIFTTAIVFFIPKQQWKKDARQALKILIWVLLAAVGINNLVFMVMRNPVRHNEESFFTRMVEQTPDSPLAHHNLGYVYYRQGNLEKAEREYRKAIELNPIFPDSRATLGNVLARTGRYEQAIHEYKMYLNLYPDTPNRAKTLEVIDMLMKQITPDGITDK
jgi:tetratricopeptide (TPR) repeat protein